MNHAQVTGLRGTNRLWSSVVVNAVNFFAENVGNTAKIFNPHLIVGYYTELGVPLFINLDFAQPLIDPEFVFPNQSSVPFDTSNYPMDYAYSPFASSTQISNTGTPVPQPPDPSAPLTLQNFEDAIPEQFFYWYKSINRAQAEGRHKVIPSAENSFLKTNTYADQVGNNSQTSVNNNFGSFSSFNFIDMLDESYCDIAKYFVKNNSNYFGGVNRNWNPAVYNEWEQYYGSVIYAQIIYLDRGHGFEFERTLIP